VKLSRRECFSSLARELPLFSHSPHSKQEDIINTLQFLKIRGRRLHLFALYSSVFFLQKPERSVYKCTEAGIYSHITVPSKVCASQVFTKLLKQVKFSSDKKIVPWPSLKATGEGGLGDLWTFYSNKAKPIVAKPKVRTDFTSYLIDVGWDGRLKTTHVKGLQQN
jgi:hypothetical protein